MRRLMALSVALVALAGCGDDSPEGDGGNPPRAQATTPASASTAQATGPSAAEEAEREQAAREAERRQQAIDRRDEARERRRDARRARSVERFYRESGGADRWSVESVEVDGGEVTVKTELFPKSSNEPSFRGACTVLIGLHEWIESAEVEGGDGVSHASWSGDDPLCEVAGL